MLLLMIHVLWSSSLHQYWYICWLKNEYIWFSGGTCRGFTSDWFWTAENWKSDIQWENRREKWGTEFIQLLELALLFCICLFFIFRKYNAKVTDFLLQEILKLRKKITSTVQVLTHLKEKLQFVQAENQVQKGRLREVEAEAAMVCIGIYIKKFISFTL